MLSLTPNVMAESVVLAHILTEKVPAWSESDWKMFESIAKMSGLIGVELSDEGINFQTVLREAKAVDATLLDIFEQTFDHLHKLTGKGSLVNEDGDERLSLIYFNFAASAFTCLALNQAEEPMTADVWAAHKECLDLYIDLIAGANVHDLIEGKVDESRAEALKAVLLFRIVKNRKS
mgnify:CR=1 FL=1